MVWYANELPESHFPLYITPLPLAVTIKYSFGTITRHCTPAKYVPKEELDIIIQAIV